MNREPTSPAPTLQRVEPDKVALLELTSYGDGGVTAALSLPTTSLTPDIGLCVRVLEYLAHYDGSSGRRIEDGVDGRGDAIRAALRWMADVDRAWVSIEKKGNAHLHWLTDEGREQLP